jgi:2-polyprenyl-6-methoxyphenol hydroxylase-like FAD-dependent oxidoreductase
MTETLIVGGGLARLTTALSLHSAGLGCRVVDKARWSARTDCIPRSGHGCTPVRDR